MITVGTVLVNLGLFFPASLNGLKGEINWTFPILFLTVGIILIVLGIKKERERLLGRGESWKCAELRTREYVLTVFACTSWFSGFFISTALLGDFSLVLSLLIWLFVSIGLTIWCRKAAHEFQESVAQ